jgi:hypothetical protein
VGDVLFVSIRGLPGRAEPHLASPSTARYQATLLMMYHAEVQNAVFFGVLDSEFTVETEVRSKSVRSQFSTASYRFEVTVISQVK